MDTRRLLGILSLLLALGSAQAATQLVIARLPVAGVAHHQASALWPQLREGDALSVVRERHNAHDPLAVRIDWQGQPLGYLPRDLSGPVASALDQGTALTARITRLREHPNPRERIVIEILADLSRP